MACYIASLITMVCVLSYQDVWWQTKQRNASKPTGDTVSLPIITFETSSLAELFYHVQGIVAVANNALREIT